MQELSMNILDIAENSAAAGASAVEITVSFADDGTLLLVIEDDGSGMDKEKLESVTDPFHTSRTTRKVGLGVPFIKMAAEQTGGDFHIESEPGKGTLVRAAFHLDHIDMVPLGDMGATMAALISGNPKMDFICSVRRKDRSFTLDTRELKQILDGVPIESPEVAVFIKGYVDENLEPVLRE